MKVVRPNVELLQREDTYEGVMKHIERCGRVCYKSEDLIEEGSAEKFIAGIIARGHESVLEHGSFILQADVEWTLHGLLNLLSGVTEEGFRPFLRIGGGFISGNVRAWRDFFKYTLMEYGALPISLKDFVQNCPVLFPEYQEDGLFELQVPSQRLGRFQIVPRTALKSEQDILAHYDQTLLFTCDRGVSHEFVRHRTLSPSQESTRYCNYAKGKFGAELTFIQPCFWDEKSPEYYWWEGQCFESEEIYMRLLRRGCTPQEARSILPNSLKTELVLTGVQKDWQHFLNLRCAKSAHPQAREVALMANELFKEDKHSIIEYKEETSND